MIVLTSKLFDALSPLILDELPRSSRLRSTTRRLSRTKTLDGGVVLDDAGYSDGDRKLTVALSGPSTAVVEEIQRLMEADGIQRMATSDAVFEGGMSSIRVEGGSVSFDFLVSENLCEAA